MFDRIFSQSSGRVVAIARLSLAALFLIATISDPSISPSVGDPAGAWPPTLRSPQSSHGRSGMTGGSTSRIAAAAHVTDIVFFMVVVLWPEGYASPYLPVFRLSPAFGSDPLGMASNCVDRGCGHPAVSRSGASDRAASRRGVRMATLHHPQRLFGCAFRDPDLVRVAAALFDRRPAGRGAGRDRKRV